MAASEEFGLSGHCAHGVPMLDECRHCFHQRHEFPEITEGLVINPGDTVIFTVGPNELDTPEQVEDYYRRIREVMPDGVKIILTSTRPTVIRREIA